ETGPFLDTDVSAHSDLVTLNVLRTMQMAHVFGERLVARRGGGMILVASLAGCTPAPYIAAYAAAKAYLMSLGQALRVEWRPAGVDVSVLAPGLVETPMLHTPGMRPDRTPFPIAAPQVVVTAALDGLGRRPVVLVGAFNKLTDVLLRRALSRRLAARALTPVLRRLADVQAPTTQVPNVR
ncbi:MAG: short-chain dehydrogenase, partial [Mycobacterium sp.]|nr:short-chain dehydrogenase [Mycobacterium sp.]